MSRYDDPRWYEEQNQEQSLPQSPTHDDFDHYPFLPASDSQQATQLPPQLLTTQLPTIDKTERFQRLLKQTLVLATLVIIAFFGGWFSNQYFGNVFTQGQQSRYYSLLFQQAWDQVDQKYVDRKSVDYKKMSYAAIQAMVDSLHDEGHSRFMDPKTIQSENKQLSGKFTGIGIYLRQDKDTKKLIITSSIPGSPAEKAGLKHNDVILAVNGTSTSGKDISATSALIQGEDGSKVTLTIQREGVDHTMDVPMTRSEIKVQNVIIHYIPESHIAHIQMTQFATDSSEQLKQALAQAKSYGATSIILDLRDNPGGFVPEAVNTASLFVSKGNVYIEQDIKGNRQPIPVTGNTVNTTDQIVILVNENSASAAEIVTGSLQDNKRATVIGQKTFGTGTVLEQVNLSDGSALLLGIQEWLTPNGHFIRKVAGDPNSGGITPDQLVKQPTNGVTLTPNDENSSNLTQQQILDSGDAQLAAAIQYLQNK